MSEAPGSAIGVRRACKAVVFDWDGTLVDTLPLKVANAGRLFADGLGLAADAVEAAYRRHSGIPRRALFEAILETLGAPPIDDETFSDLSERFTSMNQVSLRADRVFPQARAALSRLRGAGFRLAISSSATPEEIETGARAVELADFFDLILGSRNGFTKGPAHLRFVCDRFGLRVGQVCMVGDEVADVRLGKEAGVFTVARAGTLGRADLQAAGADAIIGSLTELPDLLELAPHDGVRGH